MATITEVRQATADVLADLAVVGSVTPTPTKKEPLPGDAWVTVGQLRPATFGASAQVLIATVVLAKDRGRFDDLYAVNAVQILDAITKGLPAADATLEPIELSVGDTVTGAVLYGVQVTFTTEVTPT